MVSHIPAAHICLLEAYLEEPSPATPKKVWTKIEWLLFNSRVQDQHPASLCSTFWRRIMRGQARRRQKKFELRLSNCQWILVFQYLTIWLTLETHQEISRRVEMESMKVETADFAIFVGIAAKTIASQNYITPLSIDRWLFENLTVIRLFGAPKRLEKVVPRICTRHYGISSSIYENDVSCIVESMMNHGVPLNGS